MEEQRVLSTLRNTFSPRKGLPLFQYDTLELQSSSIRVLELLPRIADNPLACKLHTFDINEAPPYAAIAYGWGDPTRCVTIICNESQHFLT
jgi:hypothetical protein